MTCTALANPTLPQIFWCVFELAAGSAALAAIILFIFGIYALYKIKVPFVVQVPIGIMLVFVCAGAGIVDTMGQPLVAGGVSAFTLMMWIIVMVVGAIVVLTFWRLRRY